MSNERDDLPRLTAASRRRARRLLLGRCLLVPASVCFVVLAAVSAAKPAAEALHFTVIPLPTLFHSENPIDWALLWATAALIAGALVPLLEFVYNDDGKRARRIMSAGDVSEFAGAVSRKLDNQAIHDLYAANSSDATPLAHEPGRQGFVMPGLPVYLLADPARAPFRFRLIWKGVKEPGDGWLSRRAAARGIDWLGYRGWRVRECREQYDSPLDELKAMACSLEEDGEGAWTIGIAPAGYGSQLATELSADVEAKGQLPWLRPVFEGWEPGGAGRAAHLEDIADGARRYSMALGVQALVVTADGFLVLQRRSGAVQSAQHGLSSSAAGGVLWRDRSRQWLKRRTRRMPTHGRRFLEGFNACTDRPWPGRACRLVLRPLGWLVVLWDRVVRVPFEWVLTRTWRIEPGLEAAVYRELASEIALYPGDMVGPNAPAFIGAGLNLRYGRDLNFYAFLRTSLTHQEVSQRRRVAPDRWEAAHLVFVPIEHVGVDGDAGSLTEPFENLLGDARHLRGALYCLAHQTEFQEARRRWTKAARERWVESGELPLEGSAPGAVAQALAPAAASRGDVARM